MNVSRSKFLGREKFPSLEQELIGDSVNDRLIHSFLSACILHFWVAVVVSEG